MSKPEVPFKAVYQSKLAELRGSPELRTEPASVLAEKYGVSVRAIQNLRKRMGVKGPPARRPGPSHNPDSISGRLRADPDLMTEALPVLAQRHNCSKELVRQVRRQVTRKNGANP